MENSKLISAVVEYFSGFGFTVLGPEPNNSANAHESKDHLPNKKSSMSAHFLEAKMEGQPGEENLILRMMADGGRTFTIIYPHDYLTPIRESNEDEHFDLEHLIAENLVFQVDETIPYRTVEQLNGHSIVEFWN